MMVFMVRWERVRVVERERVVKKEAVITQKMHQ